MRTIKAFTSVLLVLAILCSLGTINFSAYADDNFDFKDNCDFMQFFRPIEDGIEVFCATRERFPGASGFRAMMAGKPVEVISLDSARNEPVIYYCLVDVSGSISSAQLTMAKQMLHGLCNALDQGDMMLLDAFAEKHKLTDYLSDTSLISKRIDDISRTEQDTNLFRGISDSLEELNTNTDLAGMRKCLVIFSDGIDDITADVGRIRQEAEKKIDETRIPVYCMVPPVADEHQEGAKLLGSLSRRSVGGEAYFYEYGGISEEQIGRNIAADMKGDKILRLDLTGFAPKDDEFLLAVEYTDTLGNIFGDTLTIISKVLNLKKVTTSPTSTPRAVIDNPIVIEDDTSIPWLKIALGALCALAALVIILLIVKNKRDEQRRKEEEEQARQQREAEQRRNMMNQAAFTGAAAGAAAQSGWNTGTMPPPTSTARNGKIVRFIAVGNQSFVKEISLQEGRPTTVGRNRKADVVLNESDPRLSGVHFVLLMKNNRLSIKDAGSTNGTSVNGIPVKGSEIDVRNGETVSVGSYQYRVQY